MLPCMFIYLSLELNIGNQELQLNKIFLLMFAKLSLMINSFKNCHIRDTIPFKLKKEIFKIIRYTSMHYTV